MRKKYATLDKYTSPYIFNNSSTTPMDGKTKNNILICYLYTDHILTKILPAIKSEANKAFIENLVFLYGQFAVKITKIIQNYNIQGPEINEYKDILIAFENIALQGFMPLENIDIHSPEEYNSSMKKILFIDYN